MSRSRKMQLTRSRSACDIFASLPSGRVTKATGLPARSATAFSLSPKRAMNCFETSAVGMAGKEKGKGKREKGKGKREKGKGKREKDYTSPCGARACLTTTGVSSIYSSQTQRQTSQRELAPLARSETDLYIGQNPEPRPASRGTPDRLPTPAGTTQSQ